MRGIGLVGRRAAAAILLATAVVTTPAPAVACSRSGSPDPVGWSTADFFSMPIVDAAATLDLALAEVSWPLAPLKYGQKPRATSFRVIQRIKGGSPDRFTLFTAERDAMFPVSEPRFSVDGDGRVIPYGWLKEAPSRDAPPPNSCQAGYISPDPGRLYLIARDEAGRLLDQIPIYEGEEPMEAFSFLAAELPNEGHWYDNLLYASQERQRHPRYDEDAPEPVPDSSIATLTFKQPILPSAAAALLRSASVAPFAVRMAVGPLIDETRMPIAQASESLLELASVRARSNLAAESDVRIPAAEALDTYKPFQFDNDGGIIRWGQAVIAAEEKLAAARKAGVQGIVSVELVGSPAAWDTLRQDPRVKQVLTGYRLGDRRYAPAIAAGVPIYTWDGIKGAELIAKLRELAKR